MKITVYLNGQFLCMTNLTEKEVLRFISWTEDPEGSHVFIHKAKKTDEGYSTCYIYRKSLDGFFIEGCF